MKKTRTRTWIVLGCILAALLLVFALVQGDPGKQAVYDYAQQDLEQLAAQGQEGPRFFAICSVGSDTFQVGKDKISYSGRITCALYGFPESSGKIERVTLQTYIDGEGQTIEAVDLWPSLHRDIRVVEIPFHTVLPNGSTLECIIEAETADGFRYRHTAMTMNDVESLKLNCKTERCDSTGACLETLWTAEE